MPRILTVDDSRAIRMIVGRQLQPLGFEIGEAEDGNDGLIKMRGSHYDLVILDVTMPNLDGPGMLAKLRESGDKTPVIMLTSEAKTAIVTTLIRLGIADYVLKPFKGEELKIKVLKALKLPADYAPSSSSAASAAASSSASPLSLSSSSSSATAAATAAVAGTAAPATAALPTPSRALVIDDMENVHKKVRLMIPATVTLDTSLTATEGLALCRANKYALILVDSELPDTNLSSLTKQLRLLQSKVTLVAMALRTANNVTGEMRAQGFDEVLLKPFSNEAVEALVEKCFEENQELLIVQESFIRISGFRGREERLEYYFQKLSAKLKEVLSKLAEACFDSAVLDAMQLPLAQPLRAGQFMAEVARASTSVGVSLRVVGSANLATMVSRFEEAKAVRLFQSVEEARTAA
jgi:two-component system, cell cycle response regulator